MDETYDSDDHYDHDDDDDDNDDDDDEDDDDGDGDDDDNDYVYQQFKLFYIRLLSMDADTKPGETRRQRYSSLL